MLGAVVGAVLGLVDMAWSLSRTTELALETMQPAGLVALSMLVVGAFGIWIGAAAGLISAWLSPRTLPFKLSWRDIEAALLSGVGAGLLLLFFEFLRPAPTLTLMSAVPAMAVLFACLLWVIRTEIGRHLRGPLWFVEALGMVYVSGRIIYEHSRSIAMADIHAAAVVATIAFATIALYLRFSTLPLRLGPRWIALVALAAPVVVPLGIGATAGHQSRLILSERTAITYRVLELNRFFRVGGERQMPPAKGCDDPVDPPRLRAQIEVDDSSIPGADHVVLIVIDTLRADRIGHTRDGVALTENLDRFADQSVVFKRAYGTTPSTVTTVGSMLTGLATGMGDLPRWDSVQEHTIVDLLDEHGIVTGAVPAHAVMEDLVDTSAFVADEALDAVMADTPHTSPLSTRAAIGTASELADRDRGLLVAHYFDPHEPYYPRDDKFDFGRSEESRYDGEVAYTDRAVGELLDELASIFGDDHAVIIISDHGEEFWDHGYRFHAMRLYDESLRLVAMMNLPGQNQKKVIDAPVSSADVAPTILDLFGLDPVDKLEGHSWLRPLPPERRIFLHTLGRQRVGFVDERFKFIVNRRINVLELYDLIEDPGEARNLADSRPEQIGELYCDMVRWKRERNLVP